MRSSWTWPLDSARRDGKFSRSYSADQRLTVTAGNEVTDEDVSCVQDQSPLGYGYTTEDIAPSHICLVPILRSGLSMLEAVQSLLPSPVSVHHLGMYRERSTLQPVEYYNNLPYHKEGSESKIPDLAIIVDPIIATGSTVCAAIDTLRDWGVPRIISISVLASQGGLRRAAETWPEGVELWVGGLDAETDERGMIKPGLGDIGDR